MRECVRGVTQPKGGARSTRVLPEQRGFNYASRSLVQSCDVRDACERLNVDQFELRAPAPRVLLEHRCIRAHSMRRDLVGNAERPIEPY